MLQPLSPLSLKQAKQFVVEDKSLNIDVPFLQLNFTLSLTCESVRLFGTKPRFGCMKALETN
jgi:hypothetical protein